VGVPDFLIWAYKLDATRYALNLPGFMERKLVAGILSGKLKFAKSYSRVGPQQAEEW
jgi:hypothetical protein